MRWLATIMFSMSLLAASPAFAQPQLRPSAERPILLVAQLVSAEFDDSLNAQLRPLKTMKEVEAFLRANKVEYRRLRTQLDTRTADAKLLEGIANLPPGEIFVIPQKGAVLFNQIVRALSDDEAEKIENW